MEAKFCFMCGKPLRMRYPGGDPENGPAEMLCPDDHTSLEEEARMLSHNWDDVVHLTEERDIERVKAIAARWNENRLTSDSASDEELAFSDVAHQLMQLGIKAAEDEIKYMDETAAQHDDSDIPF